MMQVRESTDDGRDQLDGEPIHNGEVLNGWNGTDWQTVRYERIGRAHAFLIREDDTTHTRDCATMWFRWVRQGIPLQTRGIRTRYACLVLYHCSTLHTLSL